MTHAIPVDNDQDLELAATAYAYGHQVLGVLEVPGEKLFRSLLCKTPGREPYWVHLDDGDLRISKNKNWHSHSKVHCFRSLPHYRDLVGLKHLSGI